MKRKLKLTKLTIADLNRVKGGIPECACPYTFPELGVQNRDAGPTFSCRVCQIEP